jgi:hypothetical protein
MAMSSVGAGLQSKEKQEGNQSRKTAVSDRQREREPNILNGMPPHSNHLTGNQTPRNMVKTVDPQTHRGNPHSIQIKHER